ncbi:rRNA processing protein Fyv7 [Schizosaccharomyces japonicus yFS275]|uniref:rRNA-processing protein FYV7 n=1 Tax=Schizosaccharomyces japonicus (strain yFS275 / FY16936) TaxID=402676 RepID=B6K061_SCHJY|nr:rRNA processing protein Fyv7 [Schizosaccharomyces japonicus yFS275]EEB06211.1 rRNA processing protein Fyv7 [Schizosaccharomyces japonicus yFS275]
MATPKVTDKKKTKKGGFKFRTLPAHAYKGKEKKIKQDLIFKAKVKKSFYKSIKNEHVDDKQLKRKKATHKNGLQAVFDKQKEARKKREEERLEKLRKKEEIQKKKEDREKQKKKLRERTKSGQPVMKNQMSYLLDKIKRTQDN